MHRTQAKPAVAQQDCNRIVPASYGEHTDDLIHGWRQVRQRTLWLIRDLHVEDLNLQACMEASPAKWHLAHSTWFFETFLLAEYAPGYRWYNPAYRELFNSYYNDVGWQYPRPQRHLLSRPTVAEILDYRKYIDTQLPALLSQLPPPALSAYARLLVLGMNHEQQHQELLLTDLQLALSHNPLAPRVSQPLPVQAHAGAIKWVEMQAGVASIGADPCNGFCFDNETPVHRHLLHNHYALSNRPISNAEYLEFIDAGGYRQHQHWHSDGWSWCCRHHIQAPLYWRHADHGWQRFTLAGMQPLDDHAPVTHISWYEASAYANWRGYRLPTESEWEHAAHGLDSDDGQFADTGEWQPGMPGQADAQHGLRGMFGHVWEWTSSAYTPYPGYRQPPGAIGEYNGKFMANQYVLKGGSCATPAGHMRSSYRNFFYPRDRWQFTGLRLARDL